MSEIINFPSFKAILCHKCEEPFFYLQPDGLPAICLNCGEEQNFYAAGIKDNLPVEGIGF